MKCTAINRTWPGLTCQLEIGHLGSHWHGQVGSYNWQTVEERRAMFEAYRDAPPTQTVFERFASDHKAHRHCQACGGCLLDPAWYIQQFPAWCISCRDRIKKALPVGAEPPWNGGWEL